MSKLELFIKRCREIWEILYVEPKMMDDMIDTFVKPSFDLEKVTDEDIKVSTQAYINNIMINMSKEKNDNKE